MPLPSFDEFHAEWIAEVRDASSSVEKGRRFARKLITQWLDAPVDEEDVVYCDGAGDGGIDVALLMQGGARDAEETEGDTWYLVQAKYGTALQGPETIVNEGRKVVETLDGHRARLSSLTVSLLERLNTFRARMGPQDRLVLVMATERALSEPERRALGDVRSFGRERLGAGFDVEEISVETIYLRQSEGSAAAIRVPIAGRFVPAGDNLLVGVVPLSDLYNFLRTYRSTTHDLDRLYERNVRQFLGSKKKINKGIQHTLLQFPERFGLYNNGITVVVAGFEQASAGYLLTDPNIVNGCQTTRSVWEVLHPRLSAGGTGASSAHQSWIERLAVGAVVCKIVRVGLGTDAISDITRYTNSQNAVREKDFIALERDFKSWQRVMEEQYGVYLEIQRGGWESRRAMQNQNRAPRLDLWANAFDLLKVYGAGWMSEPGTAFGRNRDFTPDGAIFKRIMEPDPTTGDAFGATDLYAAFRVQRAADGVGFGRGTEKLARRQSRFLFYFVFIELIRGIASTLHGRTPTPQEITSAILKLRGPDEVWTELVSEAVNVIDEYLEPSDSDSTVFREESLRALNNDLNSYLKAEKLGKDRNFSRCLGELVGRMRWSVGRAQGGRPSLRDRALATLR